MTDTELLFFCDEVDRLSQAATPDWKQHAAKIVESPVQDTFAGGPLFLWKAIGSFEKTDDCVFAAFARTALPALAAEMRRLLCMLEDRDKAILLLMKELAERDRRIERLKTLELDQNWKPFS